MPKKTTKDLLVQTALHQMLDKGYAGTTVDEICDTAGVSKGSFYHYFDSKEAIGLAALESFILNAAHLMQQGAYQEIKDPVERVFGYLAHAETVAKKIWGEGCLLGTFATDLARQHPAIQGKVRTLFDQVENTMTELFLPIASFRTSNPTARELARQYLAMLEGAIVLAKAYGDWKRIPQALKGFGQYVKLLVK
ncbi:MAG: TetR/AcrR family transcriptional regulator [Nitrospirota bacterium]|nr:MAG: TetR/AcrR family transcriptional regulator [Nitrospirota bacterium]